MTDKQADPYPEIAAMCGLKFPCLVSTTEDRVVCALDTEASAALIRDAAAARLRDAGWTLRHMRAGEDNIAWWIEYDRQWGVSRYVGETRTIEDPTALLEALRLAGVDERKETTHE